MALLHEMQTALLAEGADIAPILLKFRLLAAKLGSGPLQEWVKHEIEGYPTGVEVPDYRKLEVIYKGTFSGPFGSGINNAPIPSYLIEKFAGKSWTTYEMRQSIAAVDDLVATAKSSGGTLHLNSSNLILMLQGNVYENYACNDVTGMIGASQLKEIQHAVKSRTLELLIEIESAIPAASQISIGSNGNQATQDSGKVTQIYYQTVHGTMTNVSNSGTIETINIGVTRGDETSVSAALSNAGISEIDAKEFSAILAEEQPDSKEEPFGEKAKDWIAKNIKKAADGSWKIGIGVATDVLKAAALSYYGLSS